MSINQTRALELARGISRGALDADDLADRDWILLLLAAGLNNPWSLPLIVSARVLNRFNERIGYFADAADASFDGNVPDVVAA